MAIARQSLTQGTTVTGTSQTQSVTVGAGSDLILIALIHTEVTAEAPTAVAWNSVSLTKLGEGAGASFATASIWYLKNPTPATANLVATYGAGGSHRNLAAAVFTGVDQSSTFRTVQNSTTGNGTSSSLTVPSVASGDYVLDALTIDSTGHNTTGGTHANQTIEYDSTDMSGCDRVHSTQAGADGGGMGQTWTTSAPFGHVATALIPSSAAPITDASEKLRTVRSNLRLS